ncbi:unnamed protein product [Candida verbasci]|uniref:Protein ZRG17 n=1 Tax=Candida verbasci TaxID=1227364 RepID=A0A9W4XBA9_9ASCO|nr:unnamed protein product [Candida verbasci]
MNDKTTIYGPKLIPEIMENGVSDTYPLGMSNFEEHAIQEEEEVEEEEEEGEDDEAVSNNVGNKADLGFLVSANFSSDSLNDSSPQFDYNNTFSSPRRYSNSSLNNSPVIPPPNNNRRQRPLSAFLMDSNNLISEDGIAFNNTARSRDSLNFGSKLNYTPTQLPPISPRPPSPTRSTSPSRINKHYRSKSPVKRSMSPKKESPFNFRPQEVGQNNNLQVKHTHRKGHKYKHSSVSMNMFQEPPIAIDDLFKNQNLNLITNSYPIPKFNEILLSINQNQRLRLSWSFLHLSISVLIFVIGFKFGLSSLSTLAHLVFYDSLGSILIVIVDIMTNFEVWNSSSLAYPFGLGRIEVLVGFALSASLIMVGFDLFSHFIEEFIILWVANEEHEHASSHHVHVKPNQESNWVIYESILLITMIVSLISSKFILAYDRINEIINTQTNKTSNYGLIDKDLKNQETSPIIKLIKLWQNNPTHFITLSYTVYLIFSPLIPQSLTSDLAIDLNEIATIIVATMLCFNGWNLVRALGGILLCSFPYSNYQYYLLKSRIIDLITNQEWFKKTYQIEQFYITKFNYKVYVIGMKIIMKGSDSEEEIRVRFEVNRIIKKEIDQLDSDKSIIETTIDIDRF